MKPGGGSRALWSRTLRGGLMFAAAGLLVATALYGLGRWMGFPAWGFPLWPSAVFMMGLSGMDAQAAVAWTVAIVASNALLYFLVGVVVTPLMILARSMLAKTARRGEGQ